MSEEGQEGRNAFQQGRKPDFSKYPKRPLSPLPASGLMAARPRTLPAAIAPVLVGHAPRPSWSTGRHLGWDAFVAALVGSIFIQIGTNLANDYSDAKRGADTAERLGPVRVTSSGLVAPRRVLVATWVAFGVAVARRPLPDRRGRPGDPRSSASSRSSPACSTPAGPRPYGYAGLGEVFVFLFFGLVAVNGSYYVQLEELDWMPFALSIPIGLPRDGDPRRQQPARHRHRPARRQDHAGRAARPRRARAASTPGCSRSRSPRVPVAVLVADAPAWALLALARRRSRGAPLRAVLTRTDGDVAERAPSPGPARCSRAFSVLLVGGPPDRAA